MSVVTLGEALYGAARRKWSMHRTSRLREVYLAQFGIVEANRETADEYARLRSATEALGRPIASNDLWIAATAAANGLPVATFNRRHFEPLTLQA